MSQFIQIITGGSNVKRKHLGIPIIWRRLIQIHPRKREITRQPFFSFCRPKREAQDETRQGIQERVVFEDSFCSLLKIPSKSGWKFPFKEETFLCFSVSFFCLPQVLSESHKSLAAVEPPFSFQLPMDWDTERQKTSLLFFFFFFFIMPKNRLLTRGL